MIPVVALIGLVADLAQNSFSSHPTDVQLNGVQMLGWAEIIPGLMLVLQAAVLLIKIHSQERTCLTGNGVPMLSHGWNFTFLLIYKR